METTNETLSLCLVRNSKEYSQYHWKLLKEYKRLNGERIVFQDANKDYESVEGINAGPKCKSLLSE